MARLDALLRLLAELEGSYDRRHAEARITELGLERGALRRDPGQPIESALGLNPVLGDAGAWAAGRRRAEARAGS
jgi:hypothetical protein